MEAQSAMRWKWRAGWKRSRRWRGCSIPGLPSHPQHALAMRQQKRRRHRLLRGQGRARSGLARGGQLRLLSITANLGDTKTTITHPAIDHPRPHQRGGAGGVGHRRRLLRIAVGLESPGRPAGRSGARPLSRKFKQRSGVAGGTDFQRVAATVSQSDSTQRSRLPAASLNVLAARAMGVAVDQPGAA
jgi:hypothetical protein